MMQTTHNPYSESSWRRLKALIVKEFFQIIRDPSSILISGVLPLLLMFLYGFGVSLDVNKLNIGLVAEDSSPDAQSFIQSLRDSRYFNLTIGRNVREFMDPMTKGDIRGVVVIPSYFTEYEKRPDSTAPIQVIGDGSEPNTANFVQNYIQGAWQGWLQQESYKKNRKFRPPLVNPQARYWYNEELESRNFLIPGSLAIIMTLIGTLLTALVVAREWERGTMEALLSTPVKVHELIIGKIIPYFCLGMLSMNMCVLIAVFIYKVPLRGSIWVLEVVSGIFLLTALGLGLMISTIAKNQFVAAQASIVSAFLPAFILSGFIFEIRSMPMYIQAITYFIPARYFVTCLQTLFLVGDVWPLIIRNVIWMSLIAFCFFYITVIKTVKRLD